MRRRLHPSYNTAPCPVRHPCPSRFVPSTALDAWAYGHGVKLDFIRPDKPVNNAVIESFKGRFRDECLNTKVFVSLHDARRKMEARRIDYNAHRPHGSLGNLTPREFAEQAAITRLQKQADFQLVMV